MAPPSLLHSLLLPLDRAAPDTLQAQICEGLRRAVATGALAPGARLPSTRALTSSLRVSRTTVTLALEQLIDEGLLVARARSGTFVAADALPRLPRSSAVTPMRSVLRLSRRAEELARASQAFHGEAPRPRAFRLSRPALDAFPVREWNRILARRAARLSIAQLDYDQESPQLRAAIADLVTGSRGVKVLPDQVMIFSGGQRALEFAADSILERGDTVWMEEPGYPGARHALRSAGATVIPVPVDAEGISVRDGQRLAPRARLAYVTPSHQFPLGVTMSASRRNELLRWAEAADACVIEDDDSVEFSTLGGSLPALHGLQPQGRVLYLGSFSRSVFPAIRLGYLIAPACLAEGLRAVRSALEEQLPSLVQLALADFITNGLFARHIRKMRQVYRARREALAEAVRHTGVLRIRGEAQGLNAVVDLPQGADAEQASALAAQRRIEALPLSAFHAEPGGPPALVLGFGAVRPEEIRAAVAGLAEAVEATLTPARRRGRGR